MNFKKSLKRKSSKKGQTVLEYTLLVVVAILGIIAINIGTRVRNVIISFT